MATDVSEVLELVKGSTVSFDVLIFDPNDVKEDLSIYDQATLSIREEEGGANLLLRRVADLNLSINVSAGKLTATLTQVEADALKPGTFIVDVALRETAGQKWRHLERFNCRVLNSFAPHTP